MARQWLALLEHVPDRVHRENEALIRAELKLRPKWQQLETEKDLGKVPC